MVGSGALTSSGTATALSDAGYLNSTGIRASYLEIQLDPGAGTNDLEILDKDGNIMRILEAGDVFRYEAPEQRRRVSVSRLQVRAVSGTPTFYVWYF